MFRLRSLPLTLALVFALASSYAPSLLLSQEIQTSGSRKIIAHPPLEFPRVAKELSLSGTVKIVAVVGSDGKVQRTTVVGGSPVFVPTAVEAVSKSKWTVAPHPTIETVIVSFIPVNH